MTHMLLLILVNLSKVALLNILMLQTMLRNNIYKICFALNLTVKRSRIPCNLLLVTSLVISIEFQNILKNPYNIIFLFWCMKNQFIHDKVDKTKLIYHSIYILNLITKEMWGPHPSVTKNIPTSDIVYSYYNYIEAWFKCMLFQDFTMSHSWFINFP